MEKPYTLAAGGVIYLTDTGWTKPVRVPYLFDNLSEDPVISPSGKRLLFDWWTGGGWQMFYSDWDSTINDWGPVKDPGVPINNPHPYWGINWGCGVQPGCFLDDTTLIFTICKETFISHWHNATATWDTAVSWPYIFPNSTWDGLRLGPDAGIAVTISKTKVYQSIWHDDTTLDGKVYSNYDLTVTYRDTSLDRGYGNPYTLNISLMSDSLYFTGVYSGRYEGYPSITADGKTLFFEADYNGKFTIYESHLLVDENGDTITSVVNKYPQGVPGGFKLFPVYPNPFNTSTTITYYMPVSGSIRLRLYDILGRLIRTLAEGMETAGGHQITLNGSSLSSGTYILLLETPQGVLTCKITLIK